MFFLNKFIKIDEELEKYTQDLLVLSNNYDSQGSIKFSKSTVEKAKKSTKILITFFWNKRIDIPIPKLLPVPDGSIDIYWKTKKFKLLVNIPKSNKELVNIYGEKKNHPEDEIDTKINYQLVVEVLKQWLKKIL